MMDFSSSLGQAAILALQSKLKGYFSPSLRVSKSLQAKEIARFAQGSENF